MPKKTVKPKPSVKRTPKRSAKKPAEPKKLPRPPVPGLLPTPPEVDKFLEEAVLKDRPVGDKARQRMRDDLTLQYYYGGEEIAYRHTPQGVEGLAVGLPTVGKFLREMPRELDAEVVMGHPDPW
jgi:hypothetical protein